MSMQDVRSYFRLRLNDLSLDEWTDAFNFENVPSTMLADRYHIDTKSFSTVRYSHDVLELESTVFIRSFIKGFRTLSSAYDDAVERAESIIKKCCKASDAKTKSGIKDVRFQAVEIDPIDASNDNVFLITNSFVCLVALDVDA